jgi:hypothetical protein
VQSSEDRKTLLYMATTWESVADDRGRTCPTKTKLISIDWTAQRAQIDPRGPAGRERPGNVEELDDVHAGLSALQPCDERLILPWLRPRARPASLVLKMRDRDEGRSHHRSARWRPRTDSV